MKNAQSLCVSCRNGPNIFCFMTWSKLYSIFRWSHVILRFPYMKNIDKTWQNIEDPSMVGGKPRPRYRCQDTIPILLVSIWALWSGAWYFAWPLQTDATHTHTHKELRATSCKPATRVNRTEMKKLKQFVSSAHPPWKFLQKGLIWLMHLSITAVTWGCIPSKWPGGFHSFKVNTLSFFRGWSHEYDVVFTTAYKHTNLAIQ